MHTHNSFFTSDHTAIPATGGVIHRLPTLYGAADALFFRMRALTGGHPGRHAVALPRGASAAERNAPGFRGRSRPPFHARTAFVLEDAATGGLGGGPISKRYHVNDAFRQRQAPKLRFHRRTFEVSPAPCETPENGPVALALKTCSQPGHARAGAPSAFLRRAGKSALFSQSVETRLNERTLAGFCDASLQALSSKTTAGPCFRSTLPGWNRACTA